MIPSIGRLVEYTLTALDADQINRRRSEAVAAQAGATHSGYAVHVGNSAAAGARYPLLITQVWGSSEGSAVNGQVFLDGNDSLWVTSVVEGDGERKWRPFPRV